MPGTLADLVSGFQGGYTSVVDTRRKRKINRAIDYELEKSETDARATRSDLRRMGEPDLAVGSMQMPQTYGEKLVGKVKSFFIGKPSPTGGTAIDPSQASASPVQPGVATAPGPSDYSVEATGGVQPVRYKHGGAVRKMYVDGGAVIPSNQSQQGRAIGYANGGFAIPSDDTNYGMSRQYPATQALGLASGGRVTVANPRIGYADGGLTDEERELHERRLRRAELEEAQNMPLSGGGAGEFAKDVGRNIGTNTRRRFSEWAPAGIAADQAVADAEGAANVGSAVRGNIAEGVRGLGQVGMGILEDTGIAPVAKGIGGFLGYGTDKAEGQPKAIETGEGAAVSAAVADDVPGAAQPAAGDPPGTQTPAARAAAQPAGPDDEIIDFSQVRDIDPQDMPNQSVTDWEDERRYWAASAIAHGNDPHEAMKSVDARQMRGFNSYGQQAFQMLRAGDASGAARALYAAYQYFPNGADVRFGIQKGADGQPVLIGMGTDEETGEPIKEGKPMVITAESLSVQLENMSNPSAFRTWTKDWRSVEQEMREYSEITKPKAQADIELSGAQSQYYRDRGLAELIEASKSGPKGGMKQSDYDRAFSVFREDRELQALLGGEDEATARDLTAAMSKLYLSRPGDYNGVIKFVMDSFDQGGVSQVEQDLVDAGLL